MKPSLAVLAVASFLAVDTAAAVTMALRITGLTSGTPSPQYAGIGPGTPVVLTFDVPSTDGGFPGTLFPLNVTFAGLPATGIGFSFGPPSTEVTPVLLAGSIGDVGNPAFVQLDTVALTGAAPLDLNAYTHFVPGVGPVPMLLGDAIEAAVAAGDVTQGTITLADQVGPTPVLANRWTYSFAVVPEPATAALVLFGGVAALWRRRPSGG